MIVFAGVRVFVLYVVCRWMSPDKIITAVLCATCVSWWIIILQKLIVVIRIKIFVCQEYIR